MKRIAPVDEGIETTCFFENSPKFSPWLSLLLRRGDSLLIAQERRMKWRNGPCPDRCGRLIDVGDTVVAFHIGGVWQVTEVWDRPRLFRVGGFQLPQIWPGDAAIKVDSPVVTCFRNGLELNTHPESLGPLGVPAPGVLGRVAYQKKGTTWRNLVVAQWAAHTATLWGRAPGYAGEQVPLVTVQSTRNLVFLDSIPKLAIYDVASRKAPPITRREAVRWLQGTEWVDHITGPLYNV